jgi:hypothetical protein
MVQEGTAFCPNCNAPQIRVAAPESTSPSFAPGTPGEIQPPAQPVSLSPTPPLSPTAIDWSAGGPSVLIAGILSGAFCLLPMHMLWLLPGGALAVWLYNSRRPPYMQVATGTGAKLGAVTGVLGYLVVAIPVILGFVFAGDKVWSELTTAMKQQAGANPEANVQQVFELMKTAEGKAVIAVVMMSILFVMFLVLATAGGAIGAALVRRNQQHR